MDIRCLDRSNSICPDTIHLFVPHRGSRSTIRISHFEFFSIQRPFPQNGDLAEIYTFCALCCLSWARYSRLAPDIFDQYLAPV